MNLNPLSIIPDKAQYRPGDPVRLTIRMNPADFVSSSEWHYAWTVQELHATVLHESANWPADEGPEVSISLPSAVTTRSGAYGVFITVTCGSLSYSAETAFDVAEHWRDAPRYGFLSDFEPEELGRLADAEFLRRHHINIVQFYDWLYRHDCMLPDSDEFVDPLGRKTSLAVVREKIAALREYGVASMAYVAVYASLPDYIEKHPEQGLYHNNGQTHSLGGFFHIMDISEHSAWTKHMLQEYRRVLTEMGFDGIHLDQYGFPKKAIRFQDGNPEVVALKDLYPRFIDLVREEVSRVRPDAGVIFNNVGNYPTHATAGAQQDIMYIEVWEPAGRLQDLKHTIDHARQRSGKQVVLAAYLPAFHPEKAADARQAEAGALSAMAAIFASGGYHLLLGEEERVLADSYFPKYGNLSDRFKLTLQRYYDFIVMYRDLLYDMALDDISMTFTGGINTEILFAADNIRFTPNQQLDTVWTIVKEKPGYLVMHLINLRGLDNDRWHEKKLSAPEPVEQIEIKVEMWESVEGIYWASPDALSIQPQPLDYDYVPKGDDNDSGDYIRFTLPRLNNWSLVYVATRPGVPIRKFGLPNSFS